MKAILPPPPPVHSIKRERPILKFSYLSITYTCSWRQKRTCLANTSYCNAQLIKIIRLVPAPRRNTQGLRCQIRIIWLKQCKPRWSLLQMAMMIPVSLMTLLPGSKSRFSTPTISYWIFTIRNYSQLPQGNLSCCCRPNLCFFRCVDLGGYQRGEAEIERLDLYKMASRIRGRKGKWQVSFFSVYMCLKNNEFKWKS